MPLGNLELIEESFVAAAIDPTQWVKALDVATAVADSLGAVLLPVSGRTIGSVPCTESIARTFEVYMRDGWFARDLRTRGVGLAKQRGIVDDLDIYTADEIKRLPYYQEFLAPHKLRWFGGIPIQCGADLWCLSIQRTIAQGPFSKSEKNQLAHLSKRLSGTLAIASAIGNAAAANALDAFEISGRGAALIDRQGNVFRLNKIAEMILRDDVRVVKGRLIAKNSAASAAFEGSVGKLLNSKTAAMEPPIAFAREGRPPLLAYLAKPPSITQNVLADCQIMVVFVDTEQTPRPPAKALQIVFSLTEAEARLAVQLAMGKTLEQAADSLQITKETSRSHLKGIFAKTGCHRQAELIAVLSTFLRDQNT